MSGFSDEQIDEQNYSDDKAPRLKQWEFAKKNRRESSLRLWRSCNIFQDLANVEAFVRKDGDKVLSTNDFTDANKVQLAELTTCADGYQVVDDSQIQSVLVEVFGS